MLASRSVRQTPGVLALASDDAGFRRPITARLSDPARWRAKTCLEKTTLLELLPPLACSDPRSPRLLRPHRAACFLDELGYGRTVEALLAEQIGESGAHGRAAS